MLSREREIYEIEISRIKRQQKEIEKAKKKWQKKVETKDWLKILSEKGGEDVSDSKAHRILRKSK